jgi:hypothetical protein
MDFFPKELKLFIHLFNLMLKNWKKECYGKENIEMKSKTKKEDRKNLGSFINDALRIVGSWPLR